MIGIKYKSVGRILLTALLILIFPVSFSPNNFLVPQLALAAVISDYSPEAHWTMDEASGATRADSTSNGFDLTDTNSVNAITGKLNDAVDFTSTNEQLSVTSAAITNTAGEMSVNLWFNPDSVSGTARVVYALDNGNSNFITVMYNSGNGRIYCYFGNLAETNYEQSYTAASQISIGTWYNVMCTLDSAGSKVYVDGVDETDTAPSVGSFSLPASATYDIYISNTNTGTADYTGTIDELSIFPNDEGANASTLYNSGTPLPYTGEGTPTFIPRIMSN